MMNDEHDEGKNPLHQFLTQISRFFANSTAGLGANILESVLKVDVCLRPSTSNLLLIVE